MSPLTISFVLTSITFLSLTTLDSIILASFSSFSKAFSLPYSEIVETIDARRIEATIPIVSYQSKSLSKKTILTAKAINKILIIGSPKLSTKMLMIFLFLVLVISLVPYFSLDFLTSSLVSPFIIITQ